jgi:hypothetical protein
MSYITAWEAIARVLNDKQQNDQLDDMPRALTDPRNFEVPTDVCTDPDDADHCDKLAAARLLLDCELAGLPERPEAALAA